MKHIRVTSNIKNKIKYSKKGILCCSAVSLQFWASNNALICLKGKP